MCPCLHADNNRKCYAFAPPGTRDTRSLEELARSQPAIVSPSSASASAPSSVVVPAKPTQPRSQPKPQAQAQAQAKSTSTPTPMIVSPIPFQPSKPQPKAKPQSKPATDPKQFLREARVAAAKAALDSKVTAYRKAAIARYQRKDTIQVSTYTSICNLSPLKANA